jgi:hypothetical protein
MKHFLGFIVHSVFEQSWMFAKCIAIFWRIIEVKQEKGINTTRVECRMESAKFMSNKRNGRNAKESLESALYYFQKVANLKATLIIPYYQCFSYINVQFLHQARMKTTRRVKSKTRRKRTRSVFCSLFSIACTLFSGAVPKRRDIKASGRNERQTEKRSHILFQRQMTL